MRIYLTSIITALSIACSGSTQYPTDKFSEQAPTNPNSYKSLTPQKINECGALFTSSEKDPTIFHTASPACQDYAVRSYLGALTDIVRTSYWFTEGYEAYYMKRQAELLLKQSNCQTIMIENVLLDSFRTVLHTPPPHDTKEQEEKCKKVTEESNTLTCSEVKKEYNDHLTRFETALQKANNYLETRIPLAQSHQDYQKVKHIIADEIAKNRSETEKYVCQRQPLPPAQSDQPKIEQQPQKKSKFKNPPADPITQTP